MILPAAPLYRPPHLHHDSNPKTACAVRWAVAPTAWLRGRRKFSRPPEQCLASAQPISMAHSRRAIRLQVPLIVGRRPLRSEPSHQASHETASLQKASQNPLARLIGIPSQNNSDFNIGQRTAPERLQLYDLTHIASQDSGGAGRNGWPKRGHGSRSTADQAAGS